MRKSRFIHQLLIFFVPIAAPTEPRNLKVSTTANNATLSWIPPLYDGGRNDIFYRIKYKAIKEQQFSYFSPCCPITGTSSTIPYLEPLTNYMFMVIAENGVTVEFADHFSNESRRSSVVTASTTDSERG